MGTVLTSIRKIKFGYIGRWLRDQLSRPDWFRNLVLNRSAWNVTESWLPAETWASRSPLKSCLPSRRT